MGGLHPPLNGKVFLLALAALCFWGVSGAYRHVLVGDGFWIQSSPERPRAGLGLVVSNDLEM